MRTIVIRKEKIGNYYVKEVKQGYRNFVMVNNKYTIFNFKDCINWVTKMNEDDKAYTEKLLAEERERLQVRKVDFVL